mmetsp:Transcript_298/g.636  ORF Transcript_298/g.636 Transcript_298/m.636 type:complete len:640 (-) Transcript_298:67-1986(-)
MAVKEDSASHRAPFSIYEHQESGRTELERPRLLPNDWPTSWAQHVYSRLTGLTQDSPALKLWLPWLARVNALCEEEILTNFKQHIEPFVRTLSQKPRDHLPVILTDAGIDCADHQASFRHLQNLMKEAFPNACIARLGLPDFKTRALAVRRTLEQFMPHTKGAQVVQEQDEDGGEGEWLGDLPQSSRASSKDATLMGFVDWYTEQQPPTNQHRPIVLMIEQVEGVPKNILNELLRSLSQACCRKKMPVVAFLGMAEPPQNRQHLFEKERGTTNLEESIKLFRGSNLGKAYIEELSQTHFPGLRIAPSVLQWLRDQFSQSGGSVTGLLKNMLMMVQEHLEKGSIAQLFASAPQDAQAPGATREKHFISKIRLSSTEKLRALWRDNGEVFKGGDFSTFAGKVVAEVSNWLLDPSGEPLEGVRRALMLEATIDEGVKDRLRKRSYTGQLTSESLLNPLSVGRKASDQPPDDLTFLWRLIQASVGRRVQVSDLWNAFFPYAKVAEAPARQRFGVALSGLHMMGLFSPQAPSGVSKQKEVSWRLQKRHFGRLWIGSKKRTKKTFALEAESLERLEAIVDSNSGFPPTTSTPARQVGMLKSASAWTEALRRKLRANQSQKRNRQEDQEGRRPQKKEKRARIYMGN